MVAADSRKSSKLCWGCLFMLIEMPVISRSDRGLLCFRGTGLLLCAKMHIVPHVFC